ncbi:MAG: transglycosylase domain-containing protein [Ignavibacteria bacterium]
MKNKKIKEASRLIRQLLIVMLMLFITRSAVYPQELPPVKLDYASIVLSSDGKLIGYFGDKHRVEVKSTGYISKYIIYALIATEDRDFYNHNGVSYKGLGRAIFKTLTGSTQGGSTLTMQLARNLFLTQEQTLSRKFTEINIAKEIEKKYTKDQILLLYLNTVYFGHGAWGIWAASQQYFSKTPDKLTATEAATVVGLLQSPNGYDPLKNSDKTLARRNEVLHNLLEVGRITDAEFTKFRVTPLNLKMMSGTGRHFLEHIRKESAEILESKGLSLNKDQLKIITTLNFEIQKAAEESVLNQWQQFSPNMQQAQIGLISAEAGTGRIRAMVGGSPESESRGLNHADEIRRQPGSSFKVFLYGSLLEKGITLAQPLLDAPVIVDSGTIREWRPSNSDDIFTNAPKSMINAIKHSVNACAARAITELTIPDSVVLFAQRLGIKSQLLPYPSIALGTSEVSPLEMASAFGVFASGGLYARPYSIVKIENKDNRTIYSQGIDTATVVDSATCYLLSKALEGVIDGGTATSVRHFYTGVAAGKTGTTQNSTDVWFVGYNTMLSTAIWIGYDNPLRKLSGTYKYGGTACAPVWGKMMSAISGKIKGFYDNKFARPETVQDAELCEDSGQSAVPNCKNRKIYPVNFLKLEGTCKLHGTQEATSD